MNLAVLEGDAVVDAIIDRLMADSGTGGVSALAGGRIYRDAADALIPTYPIVTVSLMAATTLRLADGGHVQSDVTVLTKVTDTGVDYRATYNLAKRIISQIDEYERVTKDGVYVVKFRLMETPAQPADFIDSKRYMYANAVWYTEAEPAD